VLLQTVLHGHQRPRRQLVDGLVALDQLREGRAQAGQLLGGVLPAQVVQALPGGVDAALLVQELFLEVLSLGWEGRK